MRIDTFWHRLISLLHLHWVDHGIIRLMYNNFYQVLPDVYRCSQPGASQIRRYQQQYGIKTIINLRGRNEQMSFWLFEKEVCDELGITLIDHRLLSRDIPSKDAIYATKTLLEQVEYPILFHCKSGADRAGLMATLSRIFIAHHPVEEAIAELDWRYGHIKQAKTGMIDFFFAAYLKDAANCAEPLPFLTWLETHYDYQQLRSDFHASWWANSITDRLLRRE
jgi:protein tyrosine/serine phosphatase